MSEPDLWRQQRERYEAAAAALYRNLAERLSGAHPAGWLSGCGAVTRAIQARLAEERDRAEWIAGVKRRLGLVAIGETVIPYRLEWPADVPAGEWHVISDHSVMIPHGWPPECRCVLLDGEQVSLGGPCPVHAAV